MILIIPLLCHIFIDRKHELQIISIFLMNKKIRPSIYFSSIISIHVQKINKSFFLQMFHSSVEKSSKEVIFQLKNNYESILKVQNYLIMKKNIRIYYT